MFLNFQFLEESSVSFKGSLLIRFLTIVMNFLVIYKRMDGLVKCSVRSYLLRPFFNKT